MVDFKLCISDPKSGKSFQREVKDSEATPFVGKNIGETLKGEVFGATGAEFEIRGGSDNCGFPMRRGIKDQRKKLALLGGVGLRKKFDKGVRKKKTVCGHKITNTISQINLKLIKEGAKPLEQVFANQELGEVTKEKTKKVEIKSPAKNIPDSKKESSKPSSKEESDTKKKTEAKSEVVTKDTKPVKSETKSADKETKSSDNEANPADQEAKPEETPGQ